MNDRKNFNHEGATMSSPDDQADERQALISRPNEKSTERMASNAPSSSVLVYLVAASAAFSSCIVGFDIGVNSPAGMLLQQDLQLSDEQLELFMGFINLFALFGAMGSSWIVHWGMKAAFFSAAVLFLIGMILVIATSNFMIMLGGRILLGIAIGISSAITPQYIAEISSKEMRGSLCSWSEIGCNIGILVGFATGLIFSEIPAGISWRLMFGTGCILPIAMIFLCCTVLVESPRWLVRHHSVDQALHTLRRLYPNESEQNLQEIIQDIQKECVEQPIHQSGGEGSTLNVWKWILGCEKVSQSVRKMLNLALFIAISHQICGIDAIQYYLVFILDASGVTSRTAQAQYLMVLGGIKLACLFVASSCVDKLGRRPLLLTSVSGMIVALLTVAFNFDAIQEVEAGPSSMRETKPILITFGGLSLYLAFFSIGMGPLGWVMPPELVSTQIRSQAVSLTTFSNRLMATFMTSTMLSLANLLDWTGYFVTLAAINGCIFVLAWLYLPETKNRKLEDLGGIIPATALEH